MAFSLHPRFFWGKNGIQFGFFGKREFWGEVRFNRNGKLGLSLSRIVFTVSRIFLGGKQEFHGEVGIEFGFWE